MPKTPLIRVLLVAAAAILPVAWWFWPASFSKGPYTVGCNQCPGGPRNSPNPLNSFSTEVIDEAAKRRGIELRWKTIEGDIEEALRGGEIDLWPRHVPNGPARDLHYTAPWLEMNYALLQREKAPRLDAREATGRKIAHMHGAFLRSIVERQAPGATAVEVSNRRDLVDGLCRGQFDASLLEARAALTLLMRTGTACRDGAFQVLPLPGASPQASIVARRSAAAAADAIREEIVRMAGDGALGRLHARWFFIPSNETQALADLLEARTNVWQWAALAIGASMLGLLSLRQTRRLRHAQQQAAAANATKSRFLASMSHEIRTPMNAVLGLTGMLLETRLDSQQHETARLIRHSAESLLHLINDVLDISKIEAGKLALDEVPFPLARLMEDTVSMVRPRAQEKSLALVVRVSPELPSVIRADRGRLGQVLLNLIANSVKFTEQGGVEVVARPAGEGRFCLAVRDTGIGIPADALPRLFSEFEQVDPTITTRYGGTGLGLAITRRLVALMGGEIHVESKLGEGSTFSITLPLVAAEELPAAAAGALHTTPMNVLLCEDNAVNQRIAMHSLRRLGHEVTVAANGQEALVAAAAADFDMILMDCHMPVMDGYEATRRLRHSTSRNRKTPVVALTAAVFQEDRDRCREAGMDDLLAKPLQLEALAAALARYAQTSSRPVNTR